MFDPTDRCRRRDAMTIRCRQHDQTDDYYLPQLRRLLDGAPRDRKVYDSLIDDVVGAPNPLDLFDKSRQRPGMYLIEALYRIQVEQVEQGDQFAEPSLAPLSYSRWVAWRRFGDAVRNRSVSFGGGVTGYIMRSRCAVIGHVRSGWEPTVVTGDPELIELLHDRWAL